jgi:hypothetical protein
MNFLCILFAVIVFYRKGKHKCCAKEIQRETSVLLIFVVNFVRDFLPDCLRLSGRFKKIRPKQEADFLLDGNEPKAHYPLFIF